MSPTAYNAITVALLVGVCLAFVIASSLSPVAVSASLSLSNEM
jgi:hypothetical protein